MELLERVARLVESYQWDSGEAETEANLIAARILAIPEIAEALWLKAHRDTKVGYERQG